MEVDMDAVVHYGEKSRDYLRSFENKGRIFR